MTAQLIQFRVTQFRSITDSGWIDADEVTALIGTNESGKTNLLTALWKLKPAKGGSINLIEDLPRKLYHKLRNAKPMETFVSADFQLDDHTVEDISTVAECTPDEVRTVRVSRSFDEKVIAEFPNENTNPKVERDQIVDILKTLSNEIAAATELRGERGLKNDIAAGIEALRKDIPAEQQLECDKVTVLLDGLRSLRPPKPMKTSTLVAALARSISTLTAAITALKRTPPSQNQEARSIAWEAVPPFVYYSQYGNLDSEIYLPHVIDNLGRDDLGVKDEARVRTLKVLFEFVQLSPQEISELGQEAIPPENNLSRTT